MDFKASTGWLESWRSRFSIGFFKVCGESADVDDNVVDDFRSKIGKIVEGYKAEDIFNADETGLFGLFKGILLALACLNHLNTKSFNSPYLLPLLCCFC
jgi:hypothetical protein